MAIEVRAPGRVNLIGEHTDYNDGFVMPAAIGFETRVTAVPRDDRQVTVASERFEGAVSFDLERLSTERCNDWTDYPAGALIELVRRGVALRGADLRISGDIPIGAGLSSSASLEIAVVLAMLAVGETRMDRLEIARLAQRAENEHVGARSGIMDQFAVLYGEEGRALFLDTRALEFKTVLVPAHARIVLCNTMVRHELASSEYNVRRRQCELAVEALRQWYPEIRALRDVTLDRLEAHASDLTPVLVRRARYIVAENERVVEALDALEGDRLDRFGLLMYASHEGLRNDYEVSCKELDLMVAIARRCDGVYGARMTGGGFGGCTVNLVDAGCVPSFRKTVLHDYHRETGTMPELYDVTLVHGAEVLHD